MNSIITISGSNFASLTMGVRAAAASLLVMSMLVSSSASDLVEGGFLEYPETAIARPALSSTQIKSFLPERGLFRFPAPYNTSAIRLTNATDCAGKDCVNYAGYSYWRNMNNHVGMPSMLVFLGFDRSRGGVGPSLLELNKSTGELNNLGPIFPKEHALSWATGEGWYFSATLPTKLYVNDGPRIARVDVITGEMKTVVDISRELGAGYILRQIHSSDNDRVHSATVRNATTYRDMGCMAFEEDTSRYHFYPITSGYDECQLDRSGEWLVIKANLDGVNGEDNLIINLRTGVERVLRDRDGAAGHSDLGHGYMIATDNWADDANTLKLWDFARPDLPGSKVYHNSHWNVAAPDHISHTNARPGVSAREQYACGSSVNSGTGVHANEIICFTLDGSEKTLVVAPAMANLSASGGDDEYARYAKGNLDVTGRYFLWTSNMGGARLDAFLVQVPSALLTGVNSPTEPAPAPLPPVIVPETPPVVAPIVPPTVDEEAAVEIQWHTTRNVSLTSGLISKTAGCDGCADAGVVSMQRIDSGPVTLEFTVPSAGPLLYAGFTRVQSIPKAKSLILGLRFQAGRAEVREKDIYRADVAYVQGDRFSIMIVGNKVKYARNGIVFHTSTRSIAYPLFAGTAHYNRGASLERVVFSND